MSLNISKELNAIAREKAAKARTKLRSEITAIEKNIKEATHRLRLRSAVGDDLGAVRMENVITFYKTQIDVLKLRLGDDDER